jgi:hypothetical protein
MICQQCGAETPSEKHPCVACGRIPTNDFTTPPPTMEAEASQYPYSVEEAANPYPGNPYPGQEYAFPPPAYPASPDGYAPAGDIATGPPPNASFPEPLQEAPKYKPSGRSGPGGVGLLWLAALIVGPIVGIVYDKVSGFFNLFLVSPILFGLLAGVALAAVIKKNKIRSPVIAACAGAVAGLISFGTNYVSDCLALRPMIVSVFSQDLADASGTPLPKAQALVERKLGPIQEIRIASRLKAASGVSISSTHDYSHRGGAPISGNLYYALELFEAVLMSGAAAAVAVGAAATFFCEPCEKWYTTHTIFRAHPSRSVDMTNYVRAQDWTSAATLPAAAPGTDKNHCDVIVKRCPSCREGQIEVTNTVDNSTKKLLTASLPQQASAKLTELGRLPSA